MTKGVPYHGLMGVSHHFQSHHDLYAIQSGVWVYRTTPKDYTSKRILALNPKSNTYTC